MKSDKGIIAIILELIFLGLVIITTLCGVGGVCFIIIRWFICLLREGI